MRLAQINPFPIQCLQRILGFLTRPAETRIQARLLYQQQMTNLWMFNLQSKLIEPVVVRVLLLRTIRRRRGGHFGL